MDAMEALIAETLHERAKDNKALKKVNEVAEALGISQPSVSQRLKRGREKLKAALEGREIDE